MRPAFMAVSRHALYYVGRATAQWAGRENLVKTGFEDFYFYLVRDNYELTKDP